REPVRLSFWGHPGRAADAAILAHILQFLPLFQASPAARRILPAGSRAAGPDSGRPEGEKMSFQFKPDESIKRGIRRMARKQLDKAIEELTGQGGVRRDEVVHDVRKRCKRLRGLLRLVRDGLGDARYREENVCLRDAARPLTEVRDARVLVDVLDRLAEH